MKWESKLNPNSPRYPTWKAIFDQDEIRIASPVPAKTRDGAFVYFIRREDVPIDIWDKLIQHIAETLRVEKSIVAEHLNFNEMYPIWKDDVIVTMDPNSIAELAGG